MIHLQANGFHSYKTKCKNFKWKMAAQVFQLTKWNNTFWMERKRKSVFTCAIVEFPWVELRLKEVWPRIMMAFSWGGGEASAGNKWYLRSDGERTLSSVITTGETECRRRDWKFTPLDAWRLNSNPGRVSRPDGLNVKWRGDGSQMWEPLTQWGGRKKQTQTERATSLLHSRRLTETMLEMFQSLEAVQMLRSRSRNLYLCH